MFLLTGLQLSINLTTSNQNEGIEMFYLYKIISDHYAVCLSRELHSKGRTAKAIKFNDKRIFWLTKMFKVAGRVYVGGW